MAKTLEKLVPQFGDRELRWLLGQKPDLVCVSTGGNVDGLRFLVMCLERGLPYVSVMQANLEATWPHDQQAERLIAVYRRAHKAYFVSDRNRVLFETQLGIGLNNVEIVRNPFNVSWEARARMAERRRRLEAGLHRQVRSQRKGQDLLMHVLATEAWKARPVTLSLFGSARWNRAYAAWWQPWESPTVFNLPDKFRTSSRCGPRIMHSPLASRYEGLPLVLVEAMLCGRPAIVTDVAGNAEMVEEGVTGFVAAAATVEFVAQALERAWKRRTDWSAMGKAARQRVETLIPKDPVTDFCERLKRCADS